MPKPKPKPKSKPKHSTISKSKKQPEYEEQDIIQSIEWAEKSKNAQWKYGVTIAVYRYKSGKKATRRQIFQEQDFGLAQDILEAFWTSVGKKQSAIKPGERLPAPKVFQNTWVVNTNRAILDGLKEEAKAASEEEKIAAEKRMAEWARQIRGSSAGDTSRSASPQVDDDNTQDDDNPKAINDEPEDQSNVREKGAAVKSKKSRKRQSDGASAEVPASKRPSRLAPLSPSDDSDSVTDPVPTPKKPRKVLAETKSNDSDHTPQKRKHPVRDHISDDEDADTAPAPKKPRKSIAAELNTVKKPRKEISG